jgi:hypothetical protein
MTDETSPIASAPVPAARGGADAATARTNAEVSRPDTAAAEYARLTPQARYLRAQHESRAADPWTSDKPLTRAPDGGLRQAGAPLDPTADAPAPDADPGPDQEPPQKNKFGEFELTDEEIRDLIGRKALEDSRRLTLPQKAEDYAFELPEGFKAPQGVEVKLDPSDPIVAEARKFALESGMSKDQFRKLVGIYAASKIAEEQAFKTAIEGELAKLGAAATPRVTAVQNFIRSQVGPDLGKAVSRMLVSAQIVEGFEKMMANHRGQGGGSFAPSRQPNEPSGVSDADYDKMTYSQKKDYAASQSNGQGRR